MPQSTVFTTATARQERSSGLVAAVAVGIFGLFLVYSAGFLNAQTIHNAAHDARHSLAFPCH